MKKLLVFAALMLASVVVQAQWQVLDVGTDKMLMDICCVNHDVIIACGENGTIVKSVDGGEHWEQKFSDESIFFKSIKFCDELNGYAYGYQSDGDGTVVKTTDGGETWNHTIYNILDYGWSNGELYVVDVDTLYVFAGGLLWKSCNGGYRFENIIYEEGHSGMIYNWIENMYFNGNVGWMVVYDEDFGRIEVLRSADYGMTWNMPFCMTVADVFSYFDYFYASHIIDDNTVRLCLYTEDLGAVVYETTNGFETYSEWPMEGFYTGWIALCDSHFNNDKEGCIMGSSGQVTIARVTFDGGSSWEDVSDGLEVAYQPVAITGVDSVYYIAANHGRVYKMEGCHPNAVGEEIDGIALYPSPTKGQVKIEAEGIKHITISNMLGQVVYNGKTNGNAFEYDFGKHGMGLYLIRIETANSVVMKKVSVVR